MRLAICLVIVGAACGGSQKPVTPAPPPDPIPKTAGPDCKSVADHMMTLADHDAAQPDQEAKIVSAFKTRCETDKWNDDARSCMATTQNPAEEDGCAKMMTPAQTTALTEARATLAGAPPKAEAATPDSEESTAHTRGAVKKKAPLPKGKGKTSDPCEGGE